MKHGWRVDRRGIVERSGLSLTPATIFREENWDVWDFSPTVLFDRSGCISQYSMHKRVLVVPSEFDLGYGATVHVPSLRILKSREMTAISRNNYSTVWRVLSAVLMCQRATLAAQVASIESDILPKSPVVQPPSLKLGIARP